MVYNNHNTLYPSVYQQIPAMQTVQPIQPMQPMYQQQMQPQMNMQGQYMSMQQPMQSAQPTQQGYQNMQNAQGVQGAQAQPNYQQQNNQSMHNMNNMNSNNADYSSNYEMNNGNDNNQSASAGQIGSHGITSTDIIWVNGQQEVENYPIAANCNGMFMDISEMKMYTKDGNTGLIRDFDLIESQDSIQRYQQMKQIENAQFPVVDSYATEVNPNQQKEEIISEVEQKMNEKISALENKLSELTDSIKDKALGQSVNETNKRGKSMKKN